jgi:hypothetical protein
MEWVLLFLLKAFALEKPFSFGNDQIVTCCCCIIINVVNEKLTSSLPIFKLFHACIHNRFENTPISSHPGRLLIALCNHKDTEPLPLTNSSLYATELLDFVKVETHIPKQIQ